MKRSPFPRRSSLLFFPFFFCFVASLWAEETKPAPQAVIQEAKGACKLLRSGAILKANAGLELAPGDRLETGSGALLTIQFSQEEALVKLAKKTVLELPSAEGTPVLLSEGLIWGKKSALAPPFPIETPVLAAAVRGAEFFIKVEGPEQALVLTKSGTVEVAFEGKNYPVGPTSLGFFKKGEGPRVVPVNEAVVSDWARPFENREAWKLGG